MTVIAGLTIAKYFTLTGLSLDILGVLVVGLRGQHRMLQFWRDAPSIFDTRAHKWMYYGASAYCYRSSPMIPVI
jgi:hypothetical protein